MTTGISVLATRKKKLIFNTHETVNVSKQNNVNKIASIRLTRKKKDKIN